VVFHDWQASQRSTRPILGTWMMVWQLTGADDRCANPVRRSFSPEYKLAILAEFDGCSESGEKGALLRREGLYLEHHHGLASTTSPGALKGAIVAPTADGADRVFRGGQTAGRERTTARQVGSGRGGDSRPGKSARALGRDLQERGHRGVVTTIMDTAINELAPVVGTKRACEALGRSRASYYRQRQPARCGRPRRVTRRGPERARSQHGDGDTERERSVTRRRPRCGPHCLMRAPIWRRSRPCIGCWPSVTSARTPRPGPSTGVCETELVATQPNEVWSWDITKLAGPTSGRGSSSTPSWTSTRVTWWAGWSPTRVGGARRATHADAIYRNGVNAGQLTLHADRQLHDVKDGEPVAL